MFSIYFSSKYLRFLFAEGGGGGRGLVHVDYFSFEKSCGKLNNKGVKNRNILGSFHLIDEYSEGL